MHNPAANDRPVWLITGASSGLGRAIASAVLAKGWNVALTARDPLSVAQIPADVGNAMTLPLDVTDPEQAIAAASAVKARFGKLDVVVNSAGYGYLVPMEEGRTDQIEKMFAINFFGVVNVIKAVLPLMRAQRVGTIVNISSLGGLMAGAGSAYYGATKFAVEGLSEALTQEVAPLGIRVIVVNPSAFRTDWLARSLDTAQRVHPDYRHTVGTMLDSLPTANGKQPGDPARAAAAIIAAVSADNPPRHLLLGNRSVDLVRSKLLQLQGDIDSWEAVSRGADFPTTT